LPEAIAADARPNAEVAPNLRLAACEITTPGLTAQAASLNPHGGRAHVRLWWQADAPLSSDYTVQVRLADAQGVWGEAADRPGDAMRMIPTSTWTPGAFIRHEVDVDLNPATPAGRFQIAVAVLDTAGNAVRAPVLCGAVDVQ
jgi:hypothetical protein